MACDTLLSLLFQKLLSSLGLILQSILKQLISILLEVHKKAYSKKNFRQWIHCKKNLSKQGFFKKKLNEKSVTIIFLRYEALSQSSFNHLFPIFASHEP